jgi:hypothetical protein
MTVHDLGSVDDNHVTDMTTAEIVTDVQWYLPRQHVVGFLI